MNFKDYFKLVSEDYKSYANEWEHYSNIEQLSFNPKQFHGDPAGYYFFPKGFQGASFWRTKPYKFTAQINPSARVLDFATVPDDEVQRIMQKAGISSTSPTMKNIYPELREKFDERKGEINTGAAKFNKFFRELGYDALFDDINIVYPNEKQLIVLNPKIISKIKLENQKHKVFQAFEKASEELYKQAELFNVQIEVSQPKKEKSQWSGKPEVSSDIRLTDDKGNYAVIRVFYNADTMKTGTVHASLALTNVRMPYGIGADYSYLDDKWTGLDNMRRGLQHVFAGIAPQE